MASPIVYEVRPSGGGWIVRIAGDSMTELYVDKDDAIARARELMSRQAYARTRVLGVTGEVEMEYSQQPQQHRR